ncbi:MAG: hypothetical protein FWF75_07810 [Propionibacteriaceae bacterium]|nr:hypothetical protein [Propionibacteriaceae bacterium]
MSTQEPTSKRIIIGTVFLCAAFVCVVVMAVMMVVNWRTYDPSSVMESLSLKARQELTALGYGCLAVIFAGVGLILRRAPRHR